MRRSLALLLVLAAPAVADPRPLPRPAAPETAPGTAAEMAAEAPEGAPAAAEPGAVCGDAALVGVPLPPLAGEGDCGVAAPVRLDSAAEVALEPPATVACETARALAAWLEASVKPALPGLAALEVVDAYSCRNRNRAAAGKLSEHSFGRALDIAAFRRADGTRVAVLGGWTEAGTGATLRRLHAAACGPFGTVLGPEANPLHADHLHLDVASRRSGPYCE